MPATARICPVRAGSSHPKRISPFIFPGRICRKIFLHSPTKNVFASRKDSESSIFLVCFILSQIFLTVNRKFRSDFKILSGQESSFRIREFAFFFSVFSAFSVFSIVSSVFFSSSKEVFTGFSSWETGTFAVVFSLFLFFFFFLFSKIPFNFSRGIPKIRTESFHSFLSDP